MRTDEDFYTIVTVIFLGMAVPIVLSVLFHDVLELYLTGRHLTYLAAGVHALVFWALIATYDLDRVNVALASIVFPVIGIVIVLFTGLAMTDLHDGFRYLFLDVDDLATYAMAFGSAGIVAVAVEWKTDRLANEYDPLPTPQIIPVVLLAILALGLLVTGAVGHVTASSADVTSVEPDATHTGRAFLNVTVESEPTELLVTVTAPDESTTTQRISRAELRNGSAAVQVEFWAFDEPDPQAGTYTVTVSGISGATVDTATYTIETVPTPSLVDTASARGGDALDLDLPADAVVYGPKHDTWTRVAVVLQNDGDITAPFYVRIFTENERIKSREIPLGPGQQGAMIFELTANETERIHADADGNVSIEIAYEDVRLRTEVELPDS